MSRRIKYLLLTLTSAISFGIMGAVSYHLFNKEDPVEIEIGAPFELTRHTGETVTDAYFRGRYLLMYFGFTHCPAICPSTLLQMTSILNQLERMNAKKAGNITPLFISVDPERDTPEMIGNYISHFHERFEGLTGTIEQLTDLAYAYGSYFSYSPAEGDDYMVNHSSFLYLIDPDGKYVTHFTPDETNEQVIQSISEKLKIG